MAAVSSWNMDEFSGVWQLTIQKQHTTSLLCAKAYVTIEVFNPLLLKPPFFNQVLHVAG
jgi:hypothetical protein